MFSYLIGDSFHETKMLRHYADAEYKCFGIVL